MDYWQRERIGALTGVGAVVLFGVAQGMTPSPPGPGSSADFIQTFIIENRGSILAQQLVTGIAVALTLWFVGSLRSTLRRAEGSAGRVSGIAYGAGVTVSGLMLLTIALHAALANGISASSSPQITESMYRLASVVIAIISFPLLVLIGATGLVSLRTGLLPRWLIAFTVVPIAGSAMGAMAIFNRTGDLAPGGTVAFYAPFVTALVWLALTSVTLIVRTGTPADTNVARRRIGDIPMRADARSVPGRRASDD